VLIFHVMVMMGGVGMCWEALTLEGGPIIRSQVIVEQQDRGEECQLRERQKCPKAKSAS